MNLIVKDMSVLQGKTYSCGVCGHKTNSRNNLQKHVRIHTGERPFKCSFCDYATGDKSNFLRHKKTSLHHLRNPDVGDEKQVLNVFKQETVFPLHLRPNQSTSYFPPR